MKEKVSPCPICRRDRDNRESYQESCDLVRKHGINFTHNPGGGVFFRKGFPDCQIDAMCNDCDRDKLKQWINDNSIPPIERRAQ